MLDKDDACHDDAVMSLVVVGEIRGFVWPRGIHEFMGVCIRTQSIEFRVCTSQGYHDFKGSPGMP